MKGHWQLVAATVTLCLLAFVVAVIGAFLSPAMPHVLFVPVPVGTLIAIVGNLAIGVLGARGAGSRVVPAATGLVWLLVAVVLGTQRAEGDLIVTGTGRGVAFLLFGTMAAAIAIGIAPRRRPLATEASATPDALLGR